MSDMARTTFRNASNSLPWTSEAGSEMGRSRFFDKATYQSIERARPNLFAKHALSWLLVVFAVGLSPPLRGAEEPVTATDLVGSVMKLSVTNDRIMRREGRQYPDKYQTDWTIEFVSEDAIRPAFIGTVYGPRGISKTPVETGGLILLGRSIETASRGGGTFTWTFENGVLSFVRTYDAGAMRATFAVSRTDHGFVCTAAVSWPKEVGKSSIVMRSFVDNSRVEILTAKQSASSCAISKASADNRLKKP
jgi:hypothetical protein